MDGKDYQRASTEKDGNKQRQSETIQDEETAISRTPIRHNTSQIQLIEGKVEGRRSRGRPRNTWTTDIGNNYQRNEILPTKESCRR